MKKVPQRMCVVCREMHDKPKLIRCVVGTDEKVEIDLTGKKNGRGAYICMSTKCIEKARKSNVLARMLKANADDVYAELLKYGQN